MLVVFSDFGQVFGYDDLFSYLCDVLCELWVEQVGVFDRGLDVIEIDVMCDVLVWCGGNVVQVVCLFGISCSMLYCWVGNSVCCCY